MRRSSTTFTALVALLLGVGSVGRADEPAAPAPEPEYPEFEPQVKGMTVHEGFIKLYRKEKEEVLFAAVPATLLEKPFFLATSVSGGSTEYSGWQWSDKLVRFEQRNKQLLLVELDTHQRAKDGTPLQEVVRRTYADRLLASLDIKGMSPSGEFLIDLGKLLASEQSTFFGVFSLDDSVARWSKVKTFPQNVEIAVQMPLRGDGTFVTLHYSISELPPLEDYTARKADDRIGYFVTAIRDYTEGDAEEGRMVRLVNRWKLEKADPTLAMSPAKEPIVFYVEKTVPIAFRRAVAEGIAEWNKAFEAVGIHDAVVVRQQTDTQFADLDPEDVRYNFFRWITSETPFAMGPSRVDPRNGRILDADIIFDDSMLRGSLRDYDVMIREGPGKLLGRSMQGWLEQHPEQHPMARFRDLAVSDPITARARVLAREVAREMPELRDALAGPDAKGRPATTKREVLALPDVVRRRQEQCQVGEGLPHQMALMRLVLGGLAETSTAGVPGMEGFVSEVVKETVMHEVGHTLGLRHNFKASSMLDLDVINSTDRPAATSASVMDYHPLNIALGSDHPQGHFVPATIGPYDMLAIQYGYAFVDEGSPELKTIPRKMAEDGLPYGTDEDAGSPDPMITRWDMGKDPVAFASYRRALVLKLWENLEARAVADDASYSRLRRAFDMTVFELGMSASFVAREVGGLGFSRDHRGDPKARTPIAVIDAKAQRAALTWVCAHVFQDDAWQVPAELQAKLAAGRWSHWGSSDEGASLDYSYLDRVAQVQGWSLFFLTADDTLARLWENEQRVGKDGDALTLPELFDTLEGALFSELATPSPQATTRQPAVSTLRQNLQDAYVRRLIAIALGNGISPPVANKLAWSRLKALEGRFRGVLDQHLDPYTRAHLETLEQKSTQARTADYVHIASGGCALGAPGAPVGLPAGLALAAFGLVLALRRRSLAAA